MIQRQSKESESSGEIEQEIVKPQYLGEKDENEFDENELRSIMKMNQNVDYQEIVAEFGD